MVVSMAMITPTASYTNYNKINLYLHFKSTKERLFEFFAVEENQKSYSVFSMDHSLVESKYSHGV